MFKIENESHDWTAWPAVAAYGRMHTSELWRSFKIFLENSPKCPFLNNLKTYANFLYFSLDLNKCLKTSNNLANSL